MTRGRSTIARAYEQAQTVWGPDQRQLTLGIVLVVSLVAFEALAVVTIAPEMTAQLGGREIYGWLYSGFFLASILGTVVSGQQADVAGPRRCLSVGLPTFIFGLALSGLAPSMTVLLVGRAFQGLGSGILVTALYVAVNVAYDDSVRSRMFALMSSAWVVPALGGPLLAGVIATYASWRWVFLGLIPLTLFVSFIKSVAPRLGVVQDGVFGTKTAQLPVTTAFIEIAVGDARLGKRHASSSFKTLLLLLRQIAMHWVVLRKPREGHGLVADMPY